MSKAQKLGKGGEERSWAQAPAARLSEHPGFGEFGSKMKSCQIDFIFFFAFLPSLGF